MRMVELDSEGHRAGLIEDALEKLRLSSPNIDGSALICGDGLMVSCSLDESLHEARVAGMGATLFHLAERSVSELRRGTAREVMVRGDDGYALAVGVAPSMVLMAITGPIARLGLVFVDLRAAAERIRALL